MTTERLRNEIKMSLFLTFTTSSGEFASSAVVMCTLITLRPAED